MDDVDSNRNISTNKIYSSKMKRGSRKTKEGYCPECNKIMTKKMKGNGWRCERCKLEIDYKKEGGKK